jgi:hypothetical protein
MSCNRADREGPRSNPSTWARAGASRVIPCWVPCTVNVSLAMATKSSTSRKGATSGGPALDRLGGSIEAAQEALKDPRRELSMGGRDLVRDLDVLLRDARKNLRGVQRTLIKDLEEMQKAAAGRRPRAKPAKRTPAATASAKRVAGKRTSATKRTGASSPPRKPAARTTRAAGKT